MEIDIKKALEEKKEMQRQFISDNGKSSTILAFLIEYFEALIEK